MFPDGLFAWQYFGQLRSRVRPKRRMMRTWEVFERSGWTPGSFCWINETVKGEAMVNLLKGAILIPAILLMSVQTNVPAQDSDESGKIRSSPVEVPDSIEGQKKLLLLDFALIEVEELRKEASKFEMRAKQAILEDKGTQLVRNLRAKSKDFQKQSNVIADRFGIGKLEGLAPTYHSRLRTRGLNRPKELFEVKQKVQTDRSRLKFNSRLQIGGHEKPDSLLFAACELAEAAALVLKKDSKTVAIEGPLKAFRAELEAYRHDLEKSFSTEPSDLEELQRQILECELIAQSLERIDFVVKPK
ncbi:MAG: hypothetical protein AAF939_14405 [Planctomycetota bacterium]